MVSCKQQLLFAGLLVVGLGLLGVRSPSSIWSPRDFSDLPSGSQLSISLSFLIASSGALLIMLCPKSHLFLHWIEIEKLLKLSKGWLLLSLKRNSLHWNWWERGAWESKRSSSDALLHHPQKHPAGTGRRLILNEYEGELAICFGKVWNRAVLRFFEHG